MAMQRISTMTLGFVLIFIGAQLNIIESYTMTPRMANFLSADGIAVEPAAVTAQNKAPYYQASWQNVSSAAAVNNPPGSREIVLPGWLCWPVLFLGAVVLLQGVSMARAG